VAITIILEDGTGVTSANAFESVANTATRIADLGLTAFAALTTAQQTAAVVRGTQRIDTRLVDGASGTPTKITQGLEAPRVGWYVDRETVDSDEIPAILLDLCAYAAEEVAKELDGTTVEVPAGVTEVQLAGGSRVKLDVATKSSSGSVSGTEAKSLLHRMMGVPQR